MRWRTGSASRRCRSSCRRSRRPASAKNTEVIRPAGSRRARTAAAGGRSAAARGRAARAGEELEPPSHASDHSGRTGRASVGVLPAGPIRGGTSDETAQDHDRPRGRRWPRCAGRPCPTRRTPAGRPACCGQPGEHRRRRSTTATPATTAGRRGRRRHGGRIGRPPALGQRQRRRGRAADLADPRHADLADRPDPPDRRDGVWVETVVRSGAGRDPLRAPGPWHRPADADGADRRAGRRRPARRLGRISESAERRGGGQPSGVSRGSAVRR